MAFSFGQRFGRNGIYTDPRVAIPLAIVFFVYLISDGYGPEREIEKFTARQVERELHLSPARARPEPVVSRSGRIEQITLDGSPVARSVPATAPWLAAGVGGLFVFSIGAAGAFLVYRRHEKELADDPFHGDDEIRDLVASRTTV